MNEILFRIRQVFNDSHKSQTEIGKSINKTPQYVWRILNIDNINPSESTIKDICREFNINENWLRYGTEPMKKPIKDEVTEYVNSLLADDNPFYDLIKGIMKTYDKLDNKSQEALQLFSEELLKELHTSATDKLHNTDSETTEAATSEPYSVKEAEEEYIKSRLNSAKNTDLSVTSITTDGKRKAINE